MKAIIILCALASPLLAETVLSGSQKDEVKSDWYMETHFTIDNNGGLFAKTRTWSKSYWHGFTGGVMICLLDDQKNPTWCSDDHHYGVNGKLLSKSDRTDTWSTQIPMEKLQDAKAYSVSHRHTPTNRTLKWAWDNKEQIMSAAKTIGALAL